MDGTGDWTELWVDQDRARLGYRDGTVYALPSAVKVAPALAGAPVVDFAHYCGNTWALTGAGLHRLEAFSGSAIGTWQPGALPALASTAKWSRLWLGSSGELWAFADDGTGASFTGSPCPR